MKKLFTIFFMCVGMVVQAQTKVSGTVSDDKGEPLPFANVALEGTYDGASADVNGKYEFTTDEKGQKLLSVTMVGFEAVKKSVTLEGSALEVNFKMKELINTLNAVVVSAGMFEASDEKKAVMMKPLDIVTTAGGNADITSVMQLLPGSNRVGEREGLFVRGGSSSETKTVIDGMIVQNPYFSSTPDVPQRGRFDPFMFKGTAFSTGGYSAQYGQALSSVLLLNTQDKQGSNSSTTLSANLVSGAITHTHKGWLTGSLYYSNISPLLKVATNSFNFEKVPQGLGAVVSVNEVLKNKATLKVFGTLSDNKSAIWLPSYDAINSKYLFDNKNFNTFNHAHYRQTYKDGIWVLQAGASYSRNNDNLALSGAGFQRKDERTQGRLVMSRLYGNNNSSTLNFGTEVHHINVSNRYNEFEMKMTDNYSAVFVETETYLSKDLALRIGARGEYTSVLDRFNVAPRISMAYKTGEYSQVSVAGGRFYQNPEKEYLYMNKALDFEIADHYIANFQRIKSGKTFRTEIFYKKYDQLVTEKTETFDPNPYRFPTGMTSNNGYGYARGFDVFLRDQKSLKNGDVWVTYSFLDTERYFRNYSKLVMPYFASKHNMSVVYKQFLTSITTNVGLTYSYSSPRPVYAPGNDLQEPVFTKPYHNVSFMASKIRQRPNNFLVFYVIVDNILNRNNVFGYRFSQDGSQKYAVNAPMRRMLLFGATFTFGKLNGRSKEAELDF
ncbi:MAG: TonB-dependent receptor [Spirosomataceae bacterium]